MSKASGWMPTTLVVSSGALSFGRRRRRFVMRARPTSLMPPALDLTNLPDADVVALAQRGARAAFRELIRRYERPVFSLIYRMVRDRELAEDLAQDTFIKVLNHIDRYRPEFKLSSWLFKIANNVAIDHSGAASSPRSAWMAPRTRRRRMPSKRPPSIAGQ